MKCSWILAAAMLGLCGCTAGSRCLVTARSVPQPVSCTGCVFDADGQILAAQGSNVVRHIVLTKTHWSMIWTLVPLSRVEWDLSPALNAQLQGTSGDAVVNLTVKAATCDPVHGLVSALVPIIPSYARIKVEADVVRLKGPPP